DFHVTGVQTCALPISFPADPRAPLTHDHHYGINLRAGEFMEEATLIASVRAIAKQAGAAIMAHYGMDLKLRLKADTSPLTAADRSEERRVGKEARRGA